MISHSPAMQHAIFLSGAILSCGLVIDSVNSFAKRKLYHDEGGLFPFSLQKRYDNKAASFIYNTAPFLFGSTGFMTIMIVRAIVASFMLAGILTGWPSFLILLVCQLVFNLRNIFTLSGADQMQTIVLAGLFSLSLDIDSLANQASVLFICGNILISYLSTGYHKIRSKKWRNGNAIAMVFNSEIFGNERLSILFASHRKVAIVASWLIFCFQLAFPFLIFAGSEWLISFLAAGCFFHLTIAVLMNLNHFFWSFVSAYPILYTVIEKSWS